MYTSAKKTPRKRKSARKVSELVGKIIQPVLARRTGMTIDLLAAWPELVGEQYRDFTRLEKINWPNRANEADPYKPGILVVACEGARALYFQHEISHICERVNVFFGFAAIAKIKIVQKPVKSLRNNGQHDGSISDLRLSRVNKKRLDHILKSVDDAELRVKLEKLGRGVMAKKTRE